MQYGHLCNNVGFLGLKKGSWDRRQRSGERSPSRSRLKYAMQRLLTLPYKQRGPANDANVGTFKARSCQQLRYDTNTAYNV